jgi:SNF2 family DNA or RNA helicase
MFGLYRLEVTVIQGKRCRDLYQYTLISNYNHSYINNVTGACQTEAPPDFRGGLLADEMGLGKTLSIICLIIANKAQTPASLPTAPTRSDMGGDLIPIKATLLIVPPPRKF